MNEVVDGGLDALVGQLQHETTCQVRNRMRIVSMMSVDIDMRNARHKN